MAYYRVKPTLAEYFKMLIKLGKEENPDYFQENVLKNIKKFWNPLMRHKAEERLINVKKDADNSEAGIDIFNDSVSEISIRPISIVKKEDKYHYNDININSFSDRVDEFLSSVFSFISQI